MDRVGGWILGRHDAGRHLHSGLDELEHVAAARCEGGAVGESAFDVVVAAHRVEVVAVVVVQRGLIAQALVRRIRVAMDLDVVRVKVHIAGLHRCPRQPDVMVA